MGPFGTFHPGFGPEMQPTAMRMPLFPQHEGQPSTGQAFNPQQRLLAPRIPNLAPAGSMGYAPPQQISTEHGSPVDQPRPFHYPPVYETPSQSGPSHAAPLFASAVDNQGVEGQQLSNSGQKVYPQSKVYSQSFDAASSFPVGNSLDHPTYMPETMLRVSDPRPSLQGGQLETMDFPYQVNQSFEIDKWTVD
jgi:hypothetical protein